MRLEPIKLTQQFKNSEMKFQVFDLEARAWIHFIVGGYFDGENYFEFQNLDEFSQFVNESKESLNIFAHFGGGYDFLFMIQNFLENDIQILNMIPRGSSLLSMKVQGLFKTHTFRDSSAILPFSLKKITESFNVETKKGEWNHADTKGYSPELAEYLKSDCLGLYQSLQVFFNFDLIKKAGPATTIASQAQKIFRTYLKDPIYQPSIEHNNLCREAAHGGRTEIFKPIGYDITEYDVNSLYPSVMRDNFFPSGKSYGCSSYKKDKLGVYRVRVTAPEMHLPIIPCKHDDKLLFPVGTFESVITSVELDYALKFGYKFQVIDGCYFEGKTKYFTDFINDLYKLRKSAKKDSVIDILAKLIMNSSYGKFLLRPDKTNLVFDAEHGAKFFKAIHLKNKSVEIYEQDVELKSFSHAGIGAFILAYARILMHEKMEPLKDDLYYMDTDSCWTKSKLKESPELGEFKKVKTYNEVCFLLPKTYVASAEGFKKVAMKGFDSRKVQGFTTENLRQVLAGDLSIYVPHDKSIAKLKTALKSNKTVIHKKAFSKRIISTYNKRVVNIKTNTTKPIKLNL